MDRNENERIVTLPKTEAAIHANFSGENNAGLRAELRRLARATGQVTGMAHTCGLKVWGRAGLEAVQEVLTQEWHALGYDRCCVGDGDPAVYGQGVAVAYLDQPPEGA